MVLTLPLSLGPFLLSTLGIFELSVVYCPITNNFHISPLDNDQENMGEYDSILCVILLILCLYRHCQAQC